MTTRPSGLPAWPTAFDPAVELDWGDPVYSRRLLREHLDQEHDSASRRRTEISHHLRRLRTLLPAPPARLLDAACGPGLYAVPLAVMGYDVDGIDIGPAVLAHARKEARQAGVLGRCRFLAEDLRQLNVASGYEAAMLIYHVLEAFPRTEQVGLLRRIRRTLVPGGTLIVEMRTRADQPEGRISTWDLVEGSLLSERRHLLLTDTVYDRQRNIFILRECAVFDDGHTLCQQTSAALTPLRRIEGLFGRGGFDVSHIFDGWSRRAADATTAGVLVVAQAR